MKNYRDLKITDFLNNNARDFVREKLLASEDASHKNDMDAFGADINVTAQAYAYLLFLYRYYFRVTVHGMENFPARGHGLIVANHAPILPVDAAMIVMAALVEPENPRIVHSIIHKDLARIPYFSTLMARTGQVVGCDDNVRRLFEKDNLILVFPTGGEVMKGSLFKHYKVEDFKVGFMEYALRYNTPIIPTCLTGVEEAAQPIGYLELPALGIKYLPITLTFPWRGLLGLIPFPAKIDIYFGPPENYYAEHAGDVDNPQIVAELVEELRLKIQNMLDVALGRAHEPEI